MTQENGSYRREEINPLSNPEIDAGNSQVIYGR